MPRGNGGGTSPVVYFAVALIGAVILMFAIRILQALGKIPLF